MLPSTFLRLKSDPLLLWVVVSKSIPISELIDEHSKSIYCPFHDDSGKPSAMLMLNDSDGIEKIHCFVCTKKQFTSYDYIKIILNQKPLDYLNNNVHELIIESTLNKAIQFKQNLNLEKIDSINSIWKKSNNDLQLFLSLLYN